MKKLKKVNTSELSEKINSQAWPICSHTRKPVQIKKWTDTIFQTKTKAKKVLKLIWSFCGTIKYAEINGFLMIFASVDYS